MAETAILLGAGLQSAASLTGAIGSYQQGRFEAEVAGRNAQAARQAAALEEARFRRQSRRNLGRRRAVLGNSGVTMEGSPLEAMVDAAMESELDALLIGHGGEVAARANQHQAAISRQRGTAGLVGNLLAAPGPLLDLDVIEAGRTLLTKGKS